MNIHDLLSLQFWLIVHVSWISVSVFNFHSPRGENIKRKNINHNKRRISTDIPSSQLEHVIKKTASFGRNERERSEP